MSLFSEKLANCEARINAVEVELIDFMETRPSSPSQWVEERLRALEDQVKRLKEQGTQTRIMLTDMLRTLAELQNRQDPGKYNTPVPATAENELDHVLTEQACAELAKANNLPLKYPDQLTYDVQQLKDWFRDGKQIHEADIKRLGKDTQLLYAELRQLTQRVKDLEFMND